MSKTMGRSLRGTFALALTAALLVPAAPQALAQADGEGLKVNFALGSAQVSPQEEAKLDQAARLYREGNPIVMIVSGATDTTGPADNNLQLSIARAKAVMDGLTGRGIPVSRLQLAARGETELEVPTVDGVPEPRNRIVEINWR